MSQLTSPRRRHAPAALVALALLGGLLAGFPGSALAQKAGIVTAVRSTESAWWQFIKTKITETGLYPDGVEQVEAAFSAPALATLAKYKLLVVLGNDYGLGSGDTTGNVLADYLDTVPGGAVLMFQPYLWQTGLSGAPAITGKFLANYALTTQSATSDKTAAKRGMVIGNDPLVDGVPEFDCGTNCVRVTGTTPQPGASVVAFWSDGTILAARGKRRVDLNMYPADESVITGSWKPVGGALITNAIYYLSVPVVQTPRKVAFPGSTLGGSSAPSTFTFRNISDSAIKITGIGIDGTGKSQFTFKADRDPSPAAPYTLPIGAIFKVAVTFKPQVQGTHKATLYLELDGLPRIEAAVEGLSKGDLYVSLSPIDFGGIPSGTTAGPATVRLKNMGMVPIDLDKPVIGDTTHFQLTTVVPDAKITMFPGASYTFDVKFVPGMDVGQMSTEVTITSTDASSPLKIPVLAMAGPPKAQVPYTSILLPDVPTGAKGAPLEVAISNVGFSDLKVEGIVADKSDFEVLNAPTAMSPMVIPAQQTKIFQLVFSPQMEGLRSGKLTIKTNEPPPMGSPDSDKIILLSGNGTTPKFKVDVTEVDFGTVDIGSAIPNKQVKITNDGDGDLRVKEVAIVSGAGATSFAVTTLETVPFILHAGATVVVTVKFVPKAAGALDATLRISTDLAMGGSATVTLKGVANGAVGQVNPATLDFGDQKVKKAVTKTITITNVGNKDLTIVKSQLVPAGTVFVPMLPVDGTKIPAGMSKTIDVTCTPAMVGPATSKIEILTDDPSVMGGTKFTVNLSVNGVVSNVSVMPAELTFQPILVGKRSEMQVIKVTNTSAVPIDNLTVAISASPMAMGDDSGNFVVVPGWKTMLGAGESADVGIVFEPRMAKAMLLATAVLKADGVQVMMTVALKGSSLSPVLSAQPGLLRFDNTIVGTQTEPKYVTLSNEGSTEIELEIIPPMTEDWIVDTAETKMMLAAGDTTRIGVTFAPKATGQRGETVEVRLKGTTTSLVRIDLDGSGLKMPAPPTEPMGGCSVIHTATRGDLLPLLVLALVGAALLFRRRRLTPGL